MPTVTVGDRRFEVAAGTRLVRALEDNGIDILHRCGGYARCTTCRVVFKSGEPEQMTEAEHKRLRDDEEDLLGKVRLSCQIVVDRDMVVEPVWRLSTSDYDNAGKRPEEQVTPEPVYMDRPYG